MPAAPLEVWMCSFGSCISRLGGTLQNLHGQLKRQLKSTKRAHIEGGTKKVLAWPITSVAPPPSSVSVRAAAPLPRSIHHESPQLSLGLCVSGACARRRAGACDRGAERDNGDRDRRVPGVARVRKAAGAEGDGSGRGWDGGWSGAYGMERRLGWLAGRRGLEKNWRRLEKIGEGCVRSGRREREGRRRGEALGALDCEACESHDV